jgi:hypothetical protein
MRGARQRDERQQNDSAELKLKKTRKGPHLSKDNSLVSIDYWYLCDELSVVQAALLVVGEDPASAQIEVERQRPGERPAGYDAAKHAISTALKRKKIEGDLVRQCDGSGPIDGSIDVEESTVDVGSLRNWLSSHGMSSGFFFARESSEPGYLTPEHPRYAPKLAAAVRAWLAFEAIPGRTPKQALVKWLREHAAEFGLSDDDGKPNETGIEEVAKVANWQTGGGAPKTQVG